MKHPTNPMHSSPNPSSAVKTDRPMKPPTKKFKVVNDGTTIERTTYKAGDIVDLDPAVATLHQDCGVCLSAVDETPADTDQSEKA